MAEDGGAVEAAPLGETTASIRDDMSRLAWRTARTYDLLPSTALLSKEPNGQDPSRRNGGATQFDTDRRSIVKAQR
jgi:hypothetical protein